jgi:hypothetical protein
MSSTYLDCRRKRRNRLVRNYLIELRSRIEIEMCNIETTSQLIQSAWECVNDFPDQQHHYLSSTALNLHSFYNGLERIFEEIAKKIDPVFPSGERWHQNLLEQMTEEIPEVRPAIISTETYVLLKDFLSFRHLIRYLYTFDINKDEIKKLIDKLPETLSNVRYELIIFCKLLDIAITEDSKDTNT